MAHRALPPGAIRRRAAFGLFDADGWTWATLKAFFWFLIIIFLQFYLPDRAYYFTVSPAIQLGYNVISPVNFCPPSNRTLPCPAPAGAVVPWDVSPAELELPAPRAGGGTIASGENLYFVGGRGADGTATADVFATQVVGTNLTAAGWSAGPTLPQPRSDAVVLSLGGTPYVIGGRDAGGAPTVTVFRGTVAEGVLTGWEEVPELALPVPLAGAAGVSTLGSMMVIGGRSTADAPSRAVYEAVLSDAPAPVLGTWVEVTELPLPEPRAEASAVLTGSQVYVLGGHGPDEAVSNHVYFLGLTSSGRPQTNPETDRPFGWGVSVNQAAQFALPEPRARHTSFVNSGVVYVLGGVTADGELARTNFWAEPDVLTGTIPEWQQMDVTDLPAPRAHAAVANVASHAYVIGGETAEGVTASLLRANLAPALPFFQLGLFGLTVPGLGLPGEIGQQLGYLVAGGLVLGTFTLLVIVGIAYSHRAATRRFIQWITRGRFRAPRDEDSATV